MLVNCSERKKPPTSSSTTMIATGVVCVKPAQTARNAELITALITRMVRKPNRRRIVAVAHFMPMAPSAVAKVTMPDWNGVMPKPTCSISGSRNGSAPRPSRKMKPPATLAKKVGSRNSVRSSAGLAVCRACTR